MKKKTRIIVLTGAGMSAESGIPTFRDSNGLWENYKIEEVATPQAWKVNPDLVQEFYNMRRKQIMQTHPNKAHIFLAKLEERFDVEIITQNIDDLHERAGSTSVMHLHGEIMLAKSSGPNPEKKYYPVKNGRIEMNEWCDDGFQLRPHVVWFGEEVPLLSKAGELVRQADIFIVIGTSLQVYPAAQLAYEAHQAHLKIFIDPNASQITSDNSFVRISSSAVEAIPALENLLY